MSVAKEFYQLTLKLIELMESSDTERESKIQQVESLLAKRESLLTELVPPYTPEDIRIGQELIQLNTKLTDLLTAEKSSIQSDIKGLQAKKESNNKYVNPYHTLTTDGMFYDKRK